MLLQGHQSASHESTMALRRALQGLGPRLAAACSSSPAIASTQTSWALAASSTHSTSGFDQLNSLLRTYATDVATVKDPLNLPPCERLSIAPDHHITYDESNYHRLPPGIDQEKTSVLVQSMGRFFYATAARLLALKFIMSMTAAADVLAMASLEVDLSGIEEGQTVTVKWRGKPVFIRHRTAEEIMEATKEDLSHLRDPEPDAKRVIKPEYLVVVGVCTHLGCVPIAGAGDYNGWFCPCHGSHYDISGRIRKGPAPYNLEVPEYRFIDDTKAIIG